jgi:hypothetical protein
VQTGGDGRLPLCCVFWCSEWSSVLEDYRLPDRFSGSGVKVRCIHVMLSLSVFELAAIVSPQRLLPFDAPHHHDLHTLTTASPLPRLLTCRLPIRLHHST